MKAYRVTLSREATQWSDEALREELTVRAAANTQTKE